MPDQDQGDAGPGGDTGPGQGDATPALCESWTHALYFDACALPEPGGALVLSAGRYVLDTDSGALTAPDGSILDISSAVLGGAAPVRAISATSVVVEADAELRMRGTLPALIASWSSIEIAGRVDVSSGSAGIGAGGDSPACAESRGQPGMATGGRGDGGGGGAFSAAGGVGGQASGGGAAGGAPVPLPEVLRGGCPGGDGAAGDGFLDNHGPGGPGGGAVHLSALESIVVDGIITAGGGGGGGGDINHGGGGGGGSGGLIGVAAPTVAINAGAVLAANGGGGGGGGGGAGVAESGQDGGPQAFPALGGFGPNGDGGGGGALDIPPGGDGTGGGGGGGGTGYVVLSADALTVDGPVVSPAPVER